MPDPIRIVLSESGPVDDPEFLSLTTIPWDACDYGEFLAICLDYLDASAESLSVKKVSYYFASNPYSTDSEPVWHNPTNGLETFEPLLTELLGKLGTNDTFAHIDKVIWDLRICELILRHAELRCEQFYLD